MELPVESKCHLNHVSCNDCRMSSLCLPLALQNEEVARLDEIVQRGRPLQKDELVYSAGEPFRAVYAVRSGAIKSYCLDNEGVEQVTGFYLPGEVFGMDGLGDDRYSTNAVALETSAVCEIPFEHFERLGTQIPSLQRHFLQLMSREITTDHQLITLLSKNSADERIATLLMSISRRNQRRNLSASRFRLPMSRADIGNYLGLTVETVSRVFSRLQKQGIIYADKKEIEILDRDELIAMTNRQASAP